MEALTHLRAAYVPRLAAQLEELGGRLDASDVREATRIAHKIAGAAGSYGLAEVSVIARRVELALEGGAPCEAQRSELDRMRTAIPTLAPVERGPVILVLGEDSREADGVVVVTDPVDALALALDRPIAAIVVPYTSGARGGRALLRSLAALDEVRDVPRFVTAVDPSEAEAVRDKLGARAVFEGPFDGAVLARIREATS